MSRPPRLSLLCIAICATFAAAPAPAQTGSYYLGGVSVGSTKSKLDQDRQARQLLPGNAIVVGTDHNNQDTAFKVFGGYQFNPYFGLEGGYFDLGKFSYSATTTTAAPATAGLLHSEKKVQGINTDVVGILPFTPSFAVFGRVGLQHAKTSTRLTSEGSAAIASAGADKRETDYKLGVGLQHTFPNRVMLRGETERYRINDGVSGRGNINVFSLSLVLPFGRGSWAMRQTSAAPVAEPAHLVENGKLDANRITTIGRSESAPVTKAEDCKGQTATTEHVNCLKADRRVEIGVSGTR